MAGEPAPSVEDPTVPATPTTSIRRQAPPFLRGGRGDGDGAGDGGVEEEKGETAAEEKDNDDGDDDDDGDDGGDDGSSPPPPPAAGGAAVATGAASSFGIEGATTSAQPPATPMAVVPATPGAPTRTGGAAPMAVIGGALAEGGSEKDSAKVRVAVWSGIIRMLCAMCRAHESSESR